MLVCFVQHLESKDKYAIQENLLHGFGCVCVLFSAMIVFVLNKSDTDKLCKTYYSMIRKLLWGNACKKVDTLGRPLEHMKALSNHECCVQARVPTPITLLKTMRLPFLQNLVRFPEFHEICWSAVGDTPLETSIPRIPG